MSLDPLRLEVVCFFQNGAMSGPFTHLFIATPQGHTKLMLQFLKIGKLALHIGQFFFQTAARAHKAASESGAIPRGRESLSV